MCVCVCVYLINVKKLVNLTEILVLLSTFHFCKSLTSTKRKTENLVVFLALLEAIVFSFKTNVC